jgi:hypothetical protein
MNNKMKMTKYCSIGLHKYIIKEMGFEIGMKGFV